MKKAITISTIYLLIALTLQSCAALNKAQREWAANKKGTNYRTDAEKIRDTRDSWIGKKEHQIYAHSYWGAPNSKSSDGLGGKMVTYSRRSTIANPYVVGQFIPVVYITTFYINSSGIIYDLKVRRETL